MKKSTIKNIQGSTLFHEYDPNGIKSLGVLMKKIVKDGKEIRDRCTNKISNPSSNNNSQTKTAEVAKTNNSKKPVKEGKPNAK
jgi:hypothetical protein